jgi:hypothetical protein
MRTYFVLSFGMFAVLAFTLAAVQWFVFLRIWDMPWRVLPSLFFVGLGLVSAGYAVIALFTTYRRGQ